MRYLVDYMWCNAKHQRGGEIVFFGLVKFGLIITESNGYHLTPSLSLANLHFSVTFGLWDNFVHV